jgi:hypothetical protein
MLQDCGVLGIKNVDLLLVCILSSLFTVCALSLLGLAFFHFIQHDDNILLFMVDYGVFFRAMNSLDISDGACPVRFRLYTFLKDSLRILFVAIHVFEFTFKFTHDQKLLSVVLDFEGIGGIVSEILRSDFAKTEGRQPTEV